MAVSNDSEQSEQIIAIPTTHRNGLNENAYFDKAEIFITELTV